MADDPGKIHTRVVDTLATKLKFPQLFGVALTLFLIDLAVPDFIPFIDEILLGLGTVLLGMWRERRPEPKPPEKNVTPR